MIPTDNEAVSLVRSGAAVEAQIKDEETALMWMKRTD
jgi:hypothetical protein